MIWTIARKQLLTNILTFKFVVGLVLCLVLFPLTAVILTQDYAERLANFNSASNRHMAKLHQARVYSQVRVSIDRRPSILSPVCEGFDKRFASSVDVSFTEIPTVSVGQSEKNPLMVALKSIDLVAIVQIVLGLLALLFTYDSYSWERERGTLALSLANPVPRHIILLAQYLGGMLTIIPMFLAGIGLALLIMTRSSSVVFSSGDWTTLGMIVLLSILYLSLLSFIGMLISTLARNTATSLVIVLFFWVIFIILLPNVCAHVASAARTIQPRSVVDAQARQLRAEFWRRAYDYARQHPRPGNVWAYSRGGETYSGDLPYPIVFLYAPREIMLWELEGLKYCLSLDMDYAERVHSLYDGYEIALAAQASLAGTIGRVSPAWIFYHAASVLAGTDSGSFLRFLERARLYRRELIRYVEGKDGLLGPAYFTRARIETLPTISELAALKSARGEQAIDEIFSWRGEEAITPLDLRDLPNWESPVQIVDERIIPALPEVGILVFLNLLFFLIAHIAFLKADVRAG
ncbi:MAG TPA: ABC transporter permease subunit [Acidobacteriota bacterium]|nr:ABC transporter permease subunit [Acidobacteriota bacterium]